MLVRHMPRSLPLAMRRALPATTSGGSIRHFNQDQAERMKAIEAQMAALKGPKNHSSSDYHLAQFNLAKLKVPLNDPFNAEFALALDPINDLAKITPGFVWLHDNDSDEEKNAVPELRDDPLVLPNLSLWEDLDSLHHFVFKSGHFMYFKRKKEWFVPIKEYPHGAYWWRPADAAPPTLEEAMERIRLLGKVGNSPDAFDFKSIKDYPSPGTADSTAA